MSVETSSLRVLVADDDAADRNYLIKKLHSMGLTAEAASDGAEALEKLAVFHPHVILSDIRMPRVDGYLLIQKLKEMEICTPVILLTQFGTIDQAVSAVHKAGAFWYLEKPVAPETLQALIMRACEQAKLSEENNRLRLVLRSQRLGQLVGEHPSMAKLFALVAQLGPKKASVLLTGESGTGKEVFARAIHESGTRQHAPFIAINCAAMPEGLLESELFGHEKGSFTGAHDRQIGKIELAHGGTLFLDEIGEMPLAMQPKLLRVLEDSKVRRLGGKSEIEVDVRFVAATNRDPHKGIAEGKLREDLFYRLAVFQLELPPLRDKKQDIPALTYTLLEGLDKKYNRVTQPVSREVLDALSRYEWPGNVRELRNVLERAQILAGDEPISIRHLPPNFSEAARLPKSEIRQPILKESANTLRVALGTKMEDVEKAVILSTYEFSGRNRRETAELLGLSVRTIQNKLRQYNLADDDDDPEEKTYAAGK